jgi:hypothetical protein
MEHCRNRKGTQMKKERNRGETHVEYCWNRKGTQMEQDRNIDRSIDETVLE